MNAVLYLISTVVDIAIFLIIAQVILSWLINFGVVNAYQPFVQTVGRALDSLTEPMLAPIRRVLPNMGGLDLSPLVLIIALNFIRILAFDILGGGGRF